MMVQLTRIYTKGGDKGKTSLGNGKRVLKSCLRIAAIGDIDEVNCFLGFAITQNLTTKSKEILLRVQNDLFDLGADLCVPESSEKLDYTPLRMSYEQVLFLEKTIDDVNENLKPLNSFILPGGTDVAASLHLARAIARRAERSIIHLTESESINPQVIQYINRLSDMLFVLARFENVQTNSEILWVPGENRS
jgi:cob(I)alamin adenosyltransferase